MSNKHNPDGHNPDGRHSDRHEVADTASGPQGNPSAEDTPAEPPTRAEWRSADRAEGCSRTSGQSLAADERGVAEQLDFLTAMVVFFVGLTGFLVGLVGLVDIGSTQGATVEETPDRVAATLAENLFVTDGASQSLTYPTEECIGGYFDQEGDRSGGFFGPPSVDCDLDGGVYDPSTPENEYLRTTTAAPADVSLNVTVRNATGSVAQGGFGTTFPTYQLGPPVPDDGDYATSTRLIKIEASTANDPGTHILEVRAW